MRLPERKRLLRLLLMIMAGAVVLNVTGVFSRIVPMPVRDRYRDRVTIDLVTIKSLVNAVERNNVPVLEFMGKIDSLNSVWTPRIVRNPFQKRSGRTTAKRVVKKRRPPAPKKRRPEVIINGIVWDESRPYAILNGEVYGVGDVLEDYTVQLITDSLVVLSSPTDVFTIDYERE